MAKLSDYDVRLGGAKGTILKWLGMLPYRCDDGGVYVLLPVTGKVVKVYTTGNCAWVVKGTYVGTPEHLRAMVVTTNGEIVAGKMTNVRELRSGAQAVYGSLVRRLS